MDLLINFLPLLLFGLILVFLLSKSNKDLKSATGSNKEVIESNNRLIEAMNRLADVIEKK